MVIREAIKSVDGWHPAIKYIMIVIATYFFMHDFFSVKLNYQRACSSSTYDVRTELRVVYNNHVNAFFLSVYAVITHVFTSHPADLAPIRNRLPILHPATG